MISWNKFQNRHPIKPLNQILFQYGVRMYNVKIILLQSYIFILNVHRPLKRGNLYWIIFLFIFCPFLTFMSSFVPCLYFFYICMYISLYSSFYTCKYSFAITYLKIKHQHMYPVSHFSSFVMVCLFFCFNGSHL